MMEGTDASAAPGRRWTGTMFKLQRFFLIASGFSLLAIAISWTLILRGHTHDDVRLVAEQRNVSMAQTLANAVWPPASVLMPQTYTDPVDRDPFAGWQVDAVSAQLQQLSRGLPILKVKIFDERGALTYSTDPGDRLGLVSDSVLLQRVMETRRPTSDLYRTDEKTAWVSPGVDVIESYLPLFGRDGRVTGAFELYSDVSELVTLGERDTFNLVAQMMLVLGSLYVMLFVIVQHADEILKQQYAALRETAEANREQNERLTEEMSRRRQAEADLEALNAKLERRVAARTGALRREVDERRRAEQALRESEQQLRATWDVALDGIVTVDHDGNIMAMNPAAEACFGYASDEVAGRPMADLIIPPHMRPLHTAGMKRFLTTGKSTMLGQRVELPAMRADGSEFDAELAIDAAAAAGGPIFVAYVRDITERKRIQASLNRLSLAVENSPSAVIITDLHGMIEYVNPTFCGVTGFDPDEVIGKSTKILKSGYMAKRVYEELWTTIFKGEVWRGELLNRKRNGELFWEWACIAPIRDADGRMTQFLALKEDITIRKEHEATLLRQANRDDLTGLPNRALALDRLSRALARAERHDEIVAAMFVDLDEFKTVNDTLGHTAGDALLRQTADRLSTLVRQTDTAARMGGDEFLVVLPDLKRPADAEVTARSIADALSEPFLVDDKEVFVSASIGIAVYPADGRDPQSLMKNADAAMNQIKADGRNAYRFFTPEMDAAAQHRLALLGPLHKAVERDEFALVFQPLVDLESGRVAAAETLLRWNNPDLGMVSPDRFIPLAEETGQIVPIGTWVLRNAVESAMVWAGFAGDAPAVTVNVSSRQWREPGFPDLVASVLEEFAFPTSRLCLEITETMLMQDQDRTEATVSALHQMGIALALDDFGTGYSALSYLQRFPVDHLKIDRSFIRNAATDRSAAALVTAILAMAKELKIDVVAEGVETQEQAGFLRTQGCQLAQGFLFSRPLPQEDFLDYLKQPRLAAE